MAQVNLSETRFPAFSSCLIPQRLTAKQMTLLFGAASGLQSVGNSSGSKLSIYLPIERRSRAAYLLSKLKAAIRSVGKTLNLLETPCVTVEWSSVLGAPTLLVCDITQTQCGDGFTERNITRSASQRAANHVIHFMRRSIARWF